MNPSLRTQTYAPVTGSLALSVLAASIPLVVVALLLGVWRGSAWRAASLSLFAYAFVGAVPR